MTTSKLKKPGQGGPKTAAGKKIASANATKYSIFTQGYLPEEDIEAKKAQREALIEQWQAYDPSRYMLILSMEQAQLGIERMMKAEKMRIEGVMASINISQPFCLQAGIPLIDYMQIPIWYFLDDATGQAAKEASVLMSQAWEEANHLKKHYSDALLAQVKDQYPALFQYVAQHFKPGYSFSSMLGSLYEQSTPVLNLASLMNEIKDKKYHLLWAENAKRFEAIIAGIKAEKILEALDLEKSTRYSNAFQNRIIKGLAALASMSQYEAQTDSMTALEWTHEVSDSQTSDDYAEAQSENATESLEESAAANSSEDVAKSSIQGVSENS